MEVLGDSKPTYQSLMNFKYLERVIKETMRLYPSVPYIGRRLKKDMPITGFFFFYLTQVVLITKYVINVITNFLTLQMVMLYPRNVMLLCLFMIIIVILKTFQIQKNLILIVFSQKILPTGILMLTFLSAQDLETV